MTNPVTNLETSPVTVIDCPTSQGPGRVHEYPVESPSALLVLGPGASGSVEAADLRAVRQTANQAGIWVALVEPFYRVAGRKVPPRSGTDEAWVESVAFVRERCPDVPLVTGGRSYGSRVAARTALLTESVGVLCLAFPEHPPGKPERSRSPELEPADTLPVLCIAGDRDPFGRPEPGSRREVLVLPGDHSLKKSLPEVAAAAVGFVRQLTPAG